MSTAVDYMLNFIEREIPAKLLKIAFKPLPINDVMNRSYSIREIIRGEVINKWLVMDINTMGVQEVAIPLTSTSMEVIEYNKCIIRIPMSMTGGRRVIGVSKLGFFNPYAYSGMSMVGLRSTTDAQNLVNKLMASSAEIPRIETGYVTLINENTFLVEDYMLVPETSWVGVDLEEDIWLSHIRPAYYRKFAEMALLACKAVIYRIMTSERDGAVIEGGQELGSLNDLVNGWSDANEQYRDLMQNKLTKYLLLNDKNSNIAHIKLLVS